jgi:hypothetical protein
VQAQVSRARIDVLVLVLALNQSGDELVHFTISYTNRLIETRLNRIKIEVIRKKLH